MAVGACERRERARGAEHTPKGPACVQVQQPQCNLLRLTPIQVRERAHALGDRERPRRGAVTPARSCMDREETRKATRAPVWAMPCPALPCGYHDGLKPIFTTLGEGCTGGGDAGARGENETDEKWEIGLPMSVPTGLKRGCGPAAWPESCRSTYAP
uniref:Uncharacterized protein n=1 Tax=Oryza punctata TaxID=4537 RepID=A0A0E0KWG1_ORYPU